MAELSRSVGNNMFTDTYRRFIEEQDEEAVDEALYEAEQQHEAFEQRMKQTREFLHEQRRSLRDQLSRGLPHGMGLPMRWDYVIKTMERRYAKGEFGEAANFAIEGYNKAMKHMLDEEMERQWKLPSMRELNARTFTKFNPVCPLRTKEGSPLILQTSLTRQENAHVLFECAEVQKEVVIPAGVKVLVLKPTHSKIRYLDTPNMSPDASIVYITEESHGGKRPDDTAKIENAMRETADPLPFAPGEWQGDP